MSWQDDFLHQEIWFVDSFSFCKMDCGVDCAKARHNCWQFQLSSRRNGEGAAAISTNQMFPSHFTFSRRGEIEAISTNQRFCFRFGADLPFETDFSSQLKATDCGKIEAIFGHILFHLLHPSFQLELYKITKYVPGLFSTRTCNRQKLTLVSSCLPNPVTYSF